MLVESLCITSPYNIYMYKYYYTEILLQFELGLRRLRYNIMIEFNLFSEKFSRKATYTQSALKAKSNMLGARIYSVIPHVCYMIIYSNYRRYVR